MGGGKRKPYSCLFCLSVTQVNINYSKFPLGLEDLQYICYIVCVSIIVLSTFQTKLVFSYGRTCSILWFLWIEDCCYPCGELSWNGSKIIGATFCSFLFTKQSLFQSRNTSIYKARYLISQLTGKKIVYIIGTKIAEFHTVSFFPSELSLVQMCPPDW